MARALIALLALLACACGRGDRDVAREWLLRDCFKAGREDLEREVRARAAALDEVFADAFEKGAPAEVRASVERSAARTYARRQAFLGSGRPTGLDPSVSGSLLKAPPEAIRARAAAHLERRWKHAALAGLALTGGVRGEEVLRRIAADAASPYRATARMARRARESAPRR